MMLFSMKPVFSLAILKPHALYSNTIMIYWLLVNFYLSVIFTGDRETFFHVMNCLELSVGIKPTRINDLALLRQG